MLDGLASFNMVLNQSINQSINKSIFLIDITWSGFVGFDVQYPILKCLFIIYLVLIMMTLYPDVSSSSSRRRRRQSKGDKTPTESK